MRNIARMTAITLVSGMLLLTGANAHAQSCGDPVELMDEMGAQVVEILNRPDMTGIEREEELGKLLGLSFDLPYVAKLIIGPTYRSLNTEQRREYQELFSTFVLRTYAHRMQQYSGQSFKIAGSQTTGKKDVVVTTILQRAGGEPFQVDWRLRCRDAGLKVIDVVVEGVSMVVAQRNEFSSTISSKGFDGLLAILREKIEQIEYS